jgi:hypothetical protein
VVKRPLQVLVVAGAVAVAAIVTVLVGRTSPPSPPTRGLSIATSIVPSSIQFGDPVVAGIDVVLDRRTIDVASVKLDGRLGPFESAGPPRVQRTDVGDVTRIRYRFELHCLQHTCLPPDALHVGGRLFRLSPLQFKFTRADGSTGSATVRWPAIESTSRLSVADLGRMTPLDQPPYQASLGLPAPTYAISPTLLLALLAAGAAVLLAAAGLLTVRFVRPRPSSSPGSPSRCPSPPRCASSRRWSARSSSWSARRSAEAFRISARRSSNSRPSCAGAASADWRAPPRRSPGPRSRPVPARRARSRPPCTCGSRKGATAMRLRTPEAAVPSVDAGAFGSARRRTLALRIVLGGGALALLGLAVAQAHGLDAPAETIIPQGRSGVVVLDLSRSIGAGPAQEVRKAIRRLDAPDERLGLVVFSDTGYELLPPGSPGTELQPFERFFVPLPGSAAGAKAVFPVSPWDESFRGGTRISTGLAAGRRALQRGHIRNGAILLVSDLATEPEDLQNMVSLGIELRRAHVPVRILALAPKQADRELFARIFGADAFVPEASSVGVRGIVDRLRTELTAPLPWHLVLASLALIVLLAANELLCGRLAIPEARTT